MQEHNIVKITDKTLTIFLIGALSGFLILLAIRMIYSFGEEVGAERMKDTVEKCSTL